MFHLHIGAAFRYNAALVTSIPLLALLAFADVFRERFPKLYALSRNSAVGWSILAAILLWWMLRNIFGW